MQRGKKPTRKKTQSEPSPSDASLPKIPKIKLPDDFKIRTNPLFRLPDELLKFPERKKGKSEAKAVTKKRPSGIFQSVFTHSWHFDRVDILLLNSVTNISVFFSDAKFYGFKKIARGVQD